MGISTDLKIAFIIDRIANIEAQPDQARKAPALAEAKDRLRQEIKTKSLNRAALIALAIAVSIPFLYEIFVGSSYEFSDEAPYRGAISLVAMVAAFAVGTTVHKCRIKRLLAQYEPWLK